MEDLSNEPPKEINPYEALHLETTATLAEVKTAYKKLALQNHPDKVAESARNEAHIKFQEIAFAYAILSEPRRRQRYDATGNTSESIDSEDGFNWSEFFKAQFADAITGEKLHKFKDSYQHSEDEKRDVLAAYTAAKGDLNKIIDQVMLSNPLSDEERFRVIIQEAIAAGDVEEYALFNQESEAKRLKRHRRAAQESEEAMEYAKELGVYDALFGSGTADIGKAKDALGQRHNTKKKPKKQEESSLADLIGKKQQARSNQFLDDLEAKYVGKAGAKNDKRGNKRKVEEPPEDLFQKNRRKRQKTPEEEVQDEDEDDRVDDLGSRDSASDTDEDQDEEVEDEEVKPTKSKADAKDRKGAKAGTARTNGVKKASAPAGKVSTRRGRKKAAAG